MEYTDLPQVLWYVMILLIVLGILGTIGNTVAIVFYSKHGLDSSTTALIIALSGVDLINTSVVIILDIVGIFGVHEKHLFACITINYILKTLFYASFLLLFCIAVDRFRKICQPFSKQFTRTQGWWFAALSGILASVLTSPIIFTSGIELITNSTSYIMINDQNVTSMCRPTVPGAMKTVYWIATCIDMTCFVFNLASIVVTNICVIVKIRSVNLNKHRMMRRQHNHSHDGISGNGSERTDTPKGVHKLASIEKTLSVMMCCITLTFIVCLIPYFVVEVGAFRPYGFQIGFMSDFGVEIAYRSLYLNCTINPYIVCLFNPQFRKLVRKRFSEEATD